MPPAGKIQMVDLKGQYTKIKHEVDEAIQAVVDSTQFINGPVVKEFENNLGEYLGVKHVIGCANGTDALQLAMMAAGLQPGDEVITTAFTFIATAEVIALLGLTPIFADVDAGTFNIDCNDIEHRITPRTKAIVPVHLFGQCADMEPLLAIAKKHNLFVIEDACQSIGALYLFHNGSYARAGSMGQVGCMSFFPSKNLGCYGDGGALFTNDDALAARLRSLANHGMTVRYYHDHTGINSRLDSIQAAVLNVKLRYLDRYNQARLSAADTYDAAFSTNNEIVVPLRHPKSTHVFHQYTMKISGADRNKLITHLQAAGVPAMVYYPVPIHLQKAFAKYGFQIGELPVTEQLCNQVISLPMHTELDETQLGYITQQVLNFLNE